MTWWNRCDPREVLLELKDGEMAIVVTDGVLVTRGHVTAFKNIDDAEWHVRFQTAIMGHKELGRRDPWPDGLVWLRLPSLPIPTYLSLIEDKDGNYLRVGGSLDRRLNRHRRALERIRGAMSIHSSVLAREVTDYIGKILADEDAKLFGED